MQIEVQCATVKQRELLQRRFGLRKKLRKIIASSIGMNQQSGSIQIDSQSFKIEPKLILCDCMISIHHFSKHVEIRAAARKGYSQPVNELIKACNDGILADVSLDLCI